MTIRHKFEQMLFEHGLSVDAASEVMNRASSSDALISMRGRWKDDVRHYPEGMRRTLWGFIAPLALEWIDANCPRAWFRGLFVTDGAVAESK